MSKRKAPAASRRAPKKANRTRRTPKPAKRATELPAQPSGARIGTLLRAVRNRPGPYWAVIRTKSGRENYARQNLERQGFEVFYPRCQPSGRGKLEPLFRTYVFVRIIDQWLKIESTYGVSGILKTDGVPTRVPPRTIKWLKRMENSDGVVELQTQRALVKGETVQIVKGAFKGHIMLYDGDTAEGRVKALYEFLGSRITVEFNRHYVAPSGALPLPAEAETDVSPGAVASQEPVSERMARQRAARLAKAASEAKRSPPTDSPQTKTPKTKSKRNAH